MNTADNLTQMRRLIEEGIGGGNLAVIDELISPTCIDHQRGNNPGAEGVRQVAQTLHRWMSDFSLTVEDSAISGDLIWTRNRARGVNTGAVMGNAPTGKAIEVDVIDICRFEDGHIVEHWGIADQLGLLLQVDGLPRRQ